MVASFHSIPWRETANGIPESMAVAKPKPCAWAMSGLSCSMTRAMEARCSRQFETWVARSECRRKCRHAVAFFDVIALDVRLAAHHVNLDLRQTRQATRERGGGDTAGNDVALNGIVADHGHAHRGAHQGGKLRAMPFDEAPNSVFETNAR